MSERSNPFLRILYFIFVPFKFIARPLNRRNEQMECLYTLELVAVLKKIELQTRQGENSYIVASCGTKQRCPAKCNGDM